MGDNYCEYNFASEPTRVRFVVRSLLEFIDGQNMKRGLKPEVRDDLKLVFSELLFNAVIHGNKGDRKKFVFVRVETSTSFVSACIKDEGPGFNYHEVLERAHSDEAIMSESGRGMVLACALTDSLTFNELGNQIKFVKNLGSGYG